MGEDTACILSAIRWMLAALSLATYSTLACNPGYALLEARRWVFVLGTVAPTA